MASSYGPRIEPQSPVRKEQIATLNRALTAEVLRHAETRVRLQRAQLKLRRTLAWCHLLEENGEA